jgi:hypothetical protein
MHARPGHTILASDQILVERLVLVPEKNDAQSGHGWRGQSSMGNFLNKRTKGCIEADAR